MQPSSDYARRVPLVACPFCREMFEEGERRTCPVCGVGLTPFEKLPPSPHSFDPDDEIPVAPEHEPLPATYMGRGRGALAVLAFVGLVLYFLPWIRLTFPMIDTRSGFELARRIPWSWGAGVAWVILVPTVMSRRSIAQLRGARVAAAFLSAIPAVTVAILFARPPHGQLVPVRFTYDWPIYATLAVSLVAFALSVRLGGRIDDMKVTRGSSRGQALQ